MTFDELQVRLRFWQAVDRIGPDIPYTHWRLHFKSTMTALCRRKFKQFGEGAEFRPGAYAIGCSHIRVGSRVVIRPGTMLHANPRSPDVEIVIEDDVLIGSGVHIYVDTHRFENVDVPIIDQGDRPGATVTVKKGAWIGANAVLLPGVTVGANAVIGAGSIVTRSIPEKVLAAGNPARVLKDLALGNLRHA